jgi:alpha,alpha-trehalose phosphorylase
VRKHERVLDFRDGVLRREVEWTSPTGRTVRVSSTRLVSFTQRAVVAIEFIVEAVDESFPVVVMSMLSANEEAPMASADPRAAAALAAPLESELYDSADVRAILVHRTRKSGLRMAAAMDHLIEGPEGTGSSGEAFPDHGRVVVTADLEPGTPLRIVKLITYGWSASRSPSALRDQVSEAGHGAVHTGWNGLLDAQRKYLDNFWERSDVEIDGDAELQQAIRFGLFHTLQAGARGEQRAIAAKGLTGPGYDGHTFWDTEMFVLPVLTYTAPRAAADAIRWRQQTIQLAYDRARTLGLRGASFPWRTIAGAECSSYWPAGTAAFHVNADIADAVIRYQMVADDPDFEHNTGTELLVATARLWRSLGHHDASGRFRIDGVTGPDEYSAIADNNIYTNLMAQRNLRAAADIIERHPNRAQELGVDGEEAASWRDAAEKMMVPYDEALGVHPQAERFTEHKIWDFASCKPDQYPLMLSFPYFDLYRKQVCKQSDLVMALFECGDKFTNEEKLRDFDYYERLTVRDSSLSACIQAVMAAEVGHMDLAYDYFAEAALMDLDDLEHNTRDGIHIASVAGTWIAAVCGFGGLRDHGGKLTFRPRLPSALTRLKFRLMFRMRSLRVEIDDKHARYSLVDGQSLELEHHGKPATIEPGKTLTLAIPKLDPPPAPATQPPGRAPVKRRPPH